MASDAPKVPAADATLRVLTYLSSQRGPVAAAKVAHDLALPRSTTYDLLKTLVDHGYALHLPHERLYTLGPAAHEVSAGYARHAPLARVGRMAIERMVDEIGESAHLAVLRDADVVYVVEERAKNRPSLITDRGGVRLPAHLTASGRAMLAALPPAQLRHLYRGPGDFVRRTDAPTPQTPGELRAALDVVRRDGYATEWSEVIAGFGSVAAVILDRAGWPLAAVTMTWAAPSLDPVHVTERAGAVRRTAAEIARAVTARRG
ncbi:MAG: IclR family transcriptional regulator [Brachybacterium sp.]|nr:IclR family transcriptional regulator [Brachybacterium sp.]